MSGFFFSAPTDQPVSGTGYNPGNLLGALSSSAEAGEQPGADLPGLQTGKGKQRGSFNKAQVSTAARGFSLFWLRVSEFIWVRKGKDESREIIMTKEYTISNI